MKKHKKHQQMIEISKNQKKDNAQDKKKESKTLIKNIPSKYKKWISIAEEQG